MLPNQQLSSKAKHAMALHFNYKCIELELSQMQSDRINN